VPGQSHLPELNQSAEKLLEEGHDDEARGPFKDLLVATHRDRAALFRKEGRWDLARDELEAAWALDRASPRLQADLAYARQEAQAARRPSSAGTLSSGERAQLARDAETLANAYDRLALIAVRHSDFIEAARYFERVQAYDPGFPNVEADRGVALYHGGRFREAAPQLEHALERNSSDLRVKKYLGLSYAELEQYARAVTVLEEVRHSQPDDEQVLLGLADSLALSGKPEEAQRVVEDLLKSSHGDSAPLHVLWGRAYASQDHLDEARREFERALAIDAKAHEAHFYLGVLSFQQAKMDEAARQFQAELANNPADSRSQYHLAVTLLRQRRLDEGLVLLRQIIQARPDYASAHYALGKALLEQGHVDEATPELETAVKLDADAAYGHYQLGRAYLLAGRKQEAERQFQITQDLKKKPRPSEDPIPP
jgi:tetratricopeptide (TPR) repeat protein